MSEDLQYWFHEDLRYWFHEDLRYWFHDIKAYMFKAWQTKDENHQYTCCICFCNLVLSNMFSFLPSNVFLLGNYSLLLWKPKLKQQV